MFPALHDVRKNGILFRYCAICDHHYIAGTFNRHKFVFAHVASTHARKMMALWYKANGR